MEPLHKNFFSFFKLFLAASFHSATNPLDLKFVSTTSEYFLKILKTFMILLTS